MFGTIWRFFSPFEVFKDASRGSLAERAAACLHNYRMRACLFTYISRWLWSSALALILTGFFEAAGTTSSGPSTGFAVLAAAYAVFAAVGVCAVLILSYAYFALSYSPGIKR